MKKLPVYLSLALAVTSLASCEKELEEVATPAVKAQTQVQKTPQQLLAGAQWRMTDLTSTTTDASSPEPVTVSLFARLKSTQRDNLTQFAADGRYVQDEGATKINPEATQQKTGSFVLSEDAKTLTVKLPDYEQQFLVEELSATTLRLKRTEGEGTASTTYVTTFAH